MECRDAQFYLRFRRSGSDELGGDVAADLDRHLAACPVCGPVARAEVAFDRAVGMAMRSVAVPEGLRNALVAHVAARRGAVLRRKAYRYTGLATAATLLVGIGLGLLNTRVDPDVSALLTWNEPQNAEEAVRNWLAKNDLPARLPADFDYALHVHHGVERLQDRDVPVVVFRDRTGPGFAKVYVFRQSARFDLKDMREHNGSQCNATVATLGEARGVAYVIVHTGPNLDPFLRRPGLTA